MTIAIGADHAGFELKQELVVILENWGYQVSDMGAYSEESADYPEFGHAVCRAVINGDADRGVIICGTGLGISMAANRHAGIRAALCRNCDMAYFSRSHNDANIIAFGARYTKMLDARAMLQVFLDTHFSDAERHARRIGKIECGGDTV